MPRYRITREARQDLKSISAYIKLDNPTAARRLNDRFHGFFAMLSRQPLSGELVVAEGKPELRCFSVGN